MAWKYGSFHSTTSIFTAGKTIVNYVICQQHLNPTSTRNTWSSTNKVDVLHVLLTELHAAHQNLPGYLCERLNVGQQTRGIVQMVELACVTHCTFTLVLNVERPGLDCPSLRPRSEVLSRRYSGPRVRHPSHAHLSCWTSFGGNDSVGSARTDWQLRRERHLVPCTTRSDRPRPGRRRWSEWGWRPVRSRRSDLRALVTLAYLLITMESSVSHCFNITGWRKYAHQRIKFPTAVKLLCISRLIYTPNLIFLS